MPKSHASRPSKRRAARKRRSTSPSCRLYVIEADGTRREIEGASGFVIKIGRTELGVTVGEDLPRVEGYVARVHTNGPLLVVGPGDGTSALLRTAKMP